MEKEREKSFFIKNPIHSKTSSIDPIKDIIKSCIIYDLIELCGANKPHDYYASKLFRKTKNFNDYSSDVFNFCYLF